ncbi:MAG TPA: hypothetical protein ENK06_02380 [Gammaproteobacteria bacterium]|nr:hypothetical protein [Gammaproteobacteria bacterium]
MQSTAAACCEARSGSRQVDGNTRRLPGTRSVLGNKYEARSGSRQVDGNTRRLPGTRSVLGNK